MENFRKYPNTPTVELERVLVKIERQGICYLCEELSDMHGTETWPMKVEHE